MSEFEDKLSAILGNPEAMGQIMSLAKSLDPGAAPPRSGEHDDAHIPSEDGFAPLMDQLDPRLMQLVMGLMTQFGEGDDERAALLTALRPFVKKKRYKKLDRAVQIAKLSRLIRAAVTAFGGGGGDV